MKALPQRLFALGCGVLALAAVAAGGAAAAPVPTVSTVVSGLDNPRDLAFGPGGRLYVAEAGSGGSECTSGGPEGEACFGASSGISLINQANHTAARILDGMASSAGADGFGATGVDGISVGPHGVVYGILTESSDAVPADVLSPELASLLQAEFGRLIAVSSGGGFTTVADVGHYDFTWAGIHKDLVPDQFPDANPYGVLSVPGYFGTEHWVVDAGANTLDFVNSRGSVSVVAFFPNPAFTDAVPTCVDRGPDGALYIGELTGGGNPPGSSIVWRWNGRGSLQAWATGLTAVTGCGFGADGRFYAAEFSTLGLDNAAPGTGELVRVPPHSTSPVTVVGGLSFPGGFAAGADGSLYVSNWSIAPAYTGLGSVKKVTLP